MVLSLLIFCTTISLRLHLGVTKAVEDAKNLSAFLNQTNEDDAPSSTTESSTLPTVSTSSRPPRPPLGVDLHCPSIENAVSTCPKDTNWVYYTCCGGANMYCCEHIQAWLLSTLAVIAVFLCLSLIACCVRCCCSYKRKTQQSYSFDEN